MACLFKGIARALGVAAAAPHLVGYAGLRLLTSRDQAFSMASERLACIPGLVGVYTRQAFYRWTLAGCGRGVYFGFMTVLSKAEARIGDGAYLGRFCVIGAADIGAGAKLADRVQVLSGRRHHQAAADDESQAATAGRIDADGVRFERVSVGPGAWIGADAVVMVDVGADTVVGAGAVVTRPVADGQTVAGVPARPVAAIAPDARRAA
ncbi:MAG: hypothetical protein AAGA57_09445 [Planctomycetota bacterium]